MLMELLVKKKRPEPETRNYGRKQSTSKGKDTVKVGKYPHTKPVERLKDKIVIAPVSIINR